MNKYSSRFTSRFVIKDGYDISDNHKVKPLLFFYGEIVSSACIFVNESSEYRNAALSTKRDVLYGIGLFYEFCCDKSMVIDSEILLIYILNEFYNTLIKGTLGKENSDIIWLARSPIDANKFIVYVKRYIEYSLEHLTVINLYGCKQESERVYRRNNEYSMLSHLESQRKNLNVLRMSVKYQGINLDCVKKQKTNYSAAVNKGFPKEKAFELITNGCLVSKNPKLNLEDRYNARNALLFSMYLYGGLRKSEPLHLFVYDVGIFDGQLNVQLAHPERAPIKCNGGEKTREEFLWESYKINPRTHLSKTEHAGWKNLEELDGRTKATTLIWVAPPEIKKLMISMHLLYIKVRQDCMKRAKYQHPYYFVDKNGNPLKVIAVDRAWEQACKRINLTGSRNQSENIHGARHMVGKMLKDLGFPANVIKTVLHHKNIQSQLQYLRVGTDDAQKVINDAFNECNFGEMNGDNIDLEHCWPKTDKDLVLTSIKELNELFAL